MVLTTDWAARGLPHDLIKSGMCVSGVYDLRPMSLTSRSDFVKFSEERIERQSAIQRIGDLGCPLSVAYGTYDSPEFQRQARAFVEAIAASGRSVRLLIGEGYNHFEIIETLANPFALLGRAALDQMAIEPLWT
jgi:arylformamidase